MATAPTVLFVDDNVAGRYALGRFLSLAGMSVRETGTGGDALRIAREEPPDVILLDVNLPDLDGREVCRRLRVDPQTAHIPIIHVSATSKSPADQVRGFDCGADAYLLEPLEPEVLVATIRALLRARNAERELAATRDQLATRIDDLTRLHELTTRLASSVDMNAVLGEILSAITVIQGTDMSALMLLDRTSGVLRLAAGVGLSPEHAAMTVQPGSGPCGTAFAERRTVVAEDLHSGGTDSALAAMALRCGFRAAHNTPLLTLGGAAVGIISTFFREPHRATEREIRLVELYARQAAQAVENARLYSEAEDGRRVLETLMQHVPEGIAIVDAAGRVRMASRHALRMAGLDGESVAGADYQARRTADLVDRNGVAPLDRRFVARRRDGDQGDGQESRARMHG
jgi:DNA-binding response OmpR family regulator